MELMLLYMFLVCVDISLTAPNNRNTSAGMKWCERLGDDIHLLNAFLLPLLAGLQDALDEDENVEIMEAEIVSVNSLFKSMMLEDLDGFAFRG